MAKGFSGKVYFEKEQIAVVAVPEMRQDGLYYEINIKGFPRFYMSWTELGRFDVVDGEGLNLPYNLVLAVSDLLEKEKKKN